MKKKKTLEMVLARAANVERLESKLTNLQKKAEDYRNFMRQNAIESRKTEDFKEQEQLMFLSEMIMQTGYPINKVAPIIGAAIEFKAGLESNDPTMQEKLSHYTEVYNQFLRENQIQPQKPEPQQPSAPSATSEDYEDDEFEEIRDEDE